MRRHPLLLCAAMALAPGAAADDGLRAYTVVDGARIPAPLTADPGDPARGSALAQTHCADCHAAPGAAERHDRAASLAAMARRLDPGALRLAVVNLGVRRPDMAGHAFHDLPAADDSGPPAPLMTAQAIEDLLAWLATLAR